MNIYVLDQQLNTIAMYDFNKSLIWSNRYCKTGDFELIMPFDNDIKEHLKQDYFVYRDVDYNNGFIERPKIIEKIERIDNAGEYSLFVSGRDATSLLDRRVVYPTEVLSGNYETLICNLINNHVVNPSDVKRRIDIFDINNTGLIDDTLDAQITGDSLLKYIEEVSEDYKIGYRTDLDLDNKKLIFKVYKGANRTNVDSNAVIISREFDNLIKYNYINDKEKYKNMAYVAGEGEEPNRKLEKINDELEGLSRREMFVDAKDLQKTDSEGHTISDADYIEQLKQRGSEKLTENKIDITNSCEIDPDGIFKFNKDYYVGDNIICDGYNRFIERIVESTESSTAAGYKTEITFEEVEEND